MLHTIGMDVRTLLLPDSVAVAPVDRLGMTLTLRKSSTCSSMALAVSPCGASLKTFFPLNAAAWLLVYGVRQDMPSKEARKHMPDLPQPQPHHKA